MESTVFKHVLNNGLTILVVPAHRIPKVSVQLWFNVGSADEKTGQRGIAHFLEHLLFKGTIRLSETDMIHIIDKLSGSCNAMTSHDFTMYLCDLPRQHWQSGCDLLADIMCNAVFKSQLFNSELCAVIQELKMYKDDYVDAIEEELVSLIFADHPYHYPVIGYNHELWNMNLDQVEQFYRQHYVPNNATLVVVGDVTPDEVIAVAESHFGSIPSAQRAAKTSPVFFRDLVQKSITLHRDVEQSTGKMAYVVPGLSSKKGYELDLLSSILGRGRGSVLYKKLVDDLACVIDVDVHIYDMFGHAVLFISYEPIEGTSFEEIEEHIFKELERFVRVGVSDNDLERAINQVRRERLLMSDDVSALGLEVGRSYLATGDATAFFDALNENKKVIKQTIEEINLKYLNKIYACTGYVAPRAQEDDAYALQLQELADSFDQQCRLLKTRTTPLEDLKHSEQIKVLPAVSISFPRCQKSMLSNGCTVLLYDRADTHLVTVVLDFNSDYYVDAWDKQGCYAFMMRMLLEGTKQYNAQELACAFEQEGIDIIVRPGSIVMTLFAGLLEKAITLLNSIITDSIFDNDRIEWVREQIYAEIKEDADDPTQTIKQYAQEKVYKKHAYAKNETGTQKTIKAITRDDLIAMYRAYITPHGSTFSIVGNFGQYNVHRLIESIFGAWTGPEIKPFDFPALHPVQKEEFVYPLNRDQVVLAFAGLSVARTDSRYDALLLFDYIFSGGNAISMGSRLFQLRERTGLFYTISGSVLRGADEQPGAIFIRTIVSRESVGTVEQLINEEIKQATELFNEQELQRACNALENSLMDCMASNYDLAVSFLFLKRYNLPDDYFDTRLQKLRSITVAQIKEAVKSILSIDKVVVLKIGRV